jgi:glycosyltransferase involved in cell wall biosynthesis
MEKKIKVLYVIHANVPNSANGSNVALLNIIDEMIKHDVEPMVVAAQYGSLCEELEKRKIAFKIIQHHCHVYPKVKSWKNALAFSPRLFILLIKNYISELQLKTIVNKFQPDLIHTNIGQIHIGYNVAKKLKIPHVWHIREYQDLGLGMKPFPSKKGFMNKLNSPSNNTIAITKGIFNHFNMSKNARVIYDGVMKEKKIQFIEKKSNYFLFLGRLNEQKGIWELVMAFIDFASFNEDFELLIAGDGSEIFINELKDIVDRSSFAKRIHFLGFRKDISELLSKATALIVPSKHEGFGFITVEAMFNGCLVVGNNSSGTKEILEGENLGILYTGHNELVLALKEIVSLGIENYYPMIEKAQIIASKLYSQEQNANEIYNFYKDILAKRSDESIH